MSTAYPYRVTATYPLTHSADCWRWHHPCAVNRLRDLAAALTATSTALGEAVREFDRAVTVNVAGADVTPDPAAPATTT